MQPEREKYLIQRASTDPAAFGELYDYYFPRLYGYVIYRVADQQDAEDIVATIFTKVLESIQRFDYRGEGAFAAWVFRIAHNAIASLFRQHKRGNIPPLSDEIESAYYEEPHQALLYKEQALILERLVKALPKQRREVVSLKFYGGLRNQEIAEILGLNERTVASHLCRGIEDLRAKYNRDSLEEGGGYE